MVKNIFLLAAAAYKDFHFLVINVWFILFLSLHQIAFPGIHANFFMTVQIYLNGIFMSYNTSPA